ncbi:MAG: ABC transporter [Spirochaetae bacterium HGW-Spirochaetae-4]|nr:MAG: ABC transporter [Spirochaetae bacterium HGW-Spirochaetae-8]PKL20858.1 MAG: ABC transporter [Spirochaetae bacterium HGW-Spirochaetae-4]
MKTAVDIADLSFTYRRYGGQAQPDPVLRTVNLSLREGSKTLVLGIPDSGKSTLSKILCALVPRHFDGDLTGTVRIDGTDISECTPWELMTRVTLVAQNPQEQLLMTTCADEVAFPLESLGVEHTALVDTVHNALQRWGLYSMAQVNPQEISGGERKRLLLAVTEAVNAPIWIMDEPFDDLDEQWRQLLLSRILEKKGTVVVFASRYLDEFRGNFDTYCHLWEGTLSCKSEVEIVVEYDRECDLQFAPMQEELDELPNHTLHCTNLSIVHPRRSVSSDQPFSLSVPDFHIASGEVVALVGPNGAGKSTLSRVLCGLDPLVEGSIAIDGTATAGKGLQTRVGYLFQNPDYGIFLPTVRDELGWSLRQIRHLGAQEREQMVSACARLFHLDLDDNPTMMGYGARKQLQAAVYYLLNRPFVIIDELDSGVTYAAAFEIVSLLRKSGAAIVIITHDRTFARNIAQRQYTIAGGVVSPSEVGV